ncbi:hypothetical protein MMC25_006707 [Agyrium rufum]|nr:hypothetical protein [Agyrium rufum]
MAHETTSSSLAFLSLEPTPSAPAAKTSLFGTVSALGSGINDVIRPTIMAFIPPLLANADHFHSFKKETFRYGSLERQMLDVYHPKTPLEPKGGRATPVLLFFYGGGMISGDRVLPHAPKGTVYTNAATFFAERGFITIVADYRLVPQGARYPSGGEDVGAVVTWAKKHFGTEQKRDLYIMGHSAGAVHTATFFLDPTFQDIRDSVPYDAEEGVALKGILLLSPPAHFRDCDPSRREMLKTYYMGDAELIDQRCPVGLLEKADPSAKQRAWISWCTYDPDDEVIRPDKVFAETWWRKERVGELTDTCLEGHNHVSPIYGLGTGVKEVEAWGEIVVAWLKEDM